MENNEVRPVIKYLYLKGMTAKEIFYDMKETLAVSVPAFSTVVKWHAEFERGRSLCDDLARLAPMWTTGNLCRLGNCRKSQQTCNE